MKIYLVFSANNSLLSKGIKCYTKEKYNHVSISLDSDLNQTYSFGRKKLSNPLVGGFVKEDFKHPFFLFSDCAVYSLDVTEKQYNMIKEKISFFNDNKHFFQYNFLGLLTLVANFKWERDDAFFCSEFVATLLTESGALAIDKELCFVKPMDLLRTPVLCKEFEGVVIDYFSERKTYYSIKELSLT